MPSLGHRAIRHAPLLFAWGMLVIVASVDVTAQVTYRGYEPQQITLPSNAPYLRSDGSIYIVGDDTMEPLLKRLNEVFVQTHPGIRFTMVLRSPPTGIDGIQAGVSLFAPVAHDAGETEIEPFKRLTGYRPLDVRIGRGPVDLVAHGDTGCYTMLMFAPTEQLMHNYSGMGLGGGTGAGRAC